MQEGSRYAVGIDVGTLTVRCVVGHIDPSSGTPTIVGVGTAPNSGMRKGVVVTLNGPAQAIDAALGEAERMSGHQISGASMTINGAHIISTKADGMIAVGGMSHEITHDDLARIEDVATSGKIPANRELLEIAAQNYRLDGQDNIKDPIGMTGTRLEISANAVSALTPHVTNLNKAADTAQVTRHAVTPPSLAAAHAVLNESQLENGVALIDFGGATTGIAIFEEGDLQYTSVIPLGGVNITNDLAIGLKTDPEVAEKVKLLHARAVTSGLGSETIEVEHDKEMLQFETSDIDEIVGARLDEIFEAIEAELKKAGRAGKLPSGVVLVGGSAAIDKLADYTKQTLRVAARIGKPTGYGGVADEIETPAFAAAVGLMLLDTRVPSIAPPRHDKIKSSGVMSNMTTAKNNAKKFFDKFKL